MKHYPNPENLYLTVVQVAGRYDVSTDTIWRWSRNGVFPKGRKIGPNATRWRLADLIEHETTFQVGMISALEFNPSFAMVA
jgi:prophage regulatory protein